MVYIFDIINKDKIKFKLEGKAGGTNDTFILLNEMKTAENLKQNNPSPGNIDESLDLNNNCKFEFSFWNRLFKSAR